MNLRTVEDRLDWLENQAAARNRPQPRAHVRRLIVRTLLTITLLAAILVVLLLLTGRRGGLR